MSELRLHETKHPNDAAKAVFASLVGIDEEKAQLVEELAFLMDRTRLDAWRKKHHPKGLPIAGVLASGAPLVVLAGEVGCGKTALATSVASAVSDRLDENVICLETPSDVRGSGLVGEISNRITTVFSIARTKLTREHRYGILVIDEADDLATSRAQLQAHHEDRSGVNVLVKQIDQLAREAPGLAVILITNRVAVLDPAIRRRVALHVEFKRPSANGRHAIFESILKGTKHTTSDVEVLVKASERDVPFSSSDLIHRVARLALAEARKDDAPLSPRLLVDALERITPTQLVGEARLAP